MTRRPRKPTAEEEALFREAFEDARPLKTSPAPPRKPVPAEPDAAPPKAQRAPAVLPGLDGRTAERLRRGALEPEARLDLHGLTEALAHRALVAFLRTAHARGLRLVLIVTGKGAKPAANDEPFDLALAGRTRGVLKTMTPRWLKEPALAPLVAEMHPAHRKHGGAGALYVYLRKKKRGHRTEVRIISLALTGHRGVDGVMAVVGPLRGQSVAAPIPRGDQPGIVEITFGDQRQRTAQLL